MNVIASSQVTTGLRYLNKKERLLIDQLRQTSHAGRQYVYDYAAIMSLSKPLHPD